MDFVRLQPKFWGGFRTVLQVFCPGVVTINFNISWYHALFKLLIWDYMLSFECCISVQYSTKPIPFSDASWIPNTFKEIVFTTFYMVLTHCNNVLYMENPISNQFLSEYSVSVIMHFPYHHKLLWNRFNFWVLGNLRSLFAFSGFSLV